MTLALFSVVTDSVKQNCALKQGRLVCQDTVSLIVKHSSTEKIIVMFSLLMFPVARQHVLESLG